MASVSNPDLSITSLRGGMNNTLPPHALPPDQCVLAENVEFFYSMLGERRLGCEPISIAGSTLDTQSEIVHLSQNFPTNEFTEPEWWAIGATVGSSVVMAHKFEGLWSPVTPDDPISPNGPAIYEIQAQPLHGKDFFTYTATDPTINRLHVWDGTSLRRAGLAQPPAAPTAVNEGSGSTYTTIRYFRIRYIRKVGTQLVLQSEPSDAVTFTPSGTGAGATITRPALIGESETGWVIEASIDNANFYALAEILDAVLTYTDETQDNQDYADEGDLSEAIGSYLTIPSARFIAADGDRLILGSIFGPDESLWSRVMWTPVYTDPGVGNDERMPIVETGGAPINSFLDLDATDGGSLTGISQVANGSWYAFKWSQIYKLTRTNDSTNAYLSTPLSKSRGAIPGSILSGMDEFGQACIYFLDPVVGPSRLGNAGLEVIQGLRQTWQTVNLKAAGITARGTYYPDKQQVHWWMATGIGDFPNYKLVLQVSEIQDSGRGATRGWAVATGHITEIRSVAVFNEFEASDTGVSLHERPFIGMTSTNADFIQRCDKGGLDAGQSYIARIVTQAYLLTGLLNQWGAMTAALMATANSTARVLVKLIRNFGVETHEVETDLAATGSETYVIKPFDQLVMSEAKAVQIEFTDPA